MLAHEAVTTLSDGLLALSELLQVPLLWRPVRIPHVIPGVPVEQILHCNAFCLAVKADAARNRCCARTESSDLAKETIRRPGPWLKRCHAEVVELVLPIRRADQLVGYLIAGPFRRPGIRPSAADLHQAHAALPVLERHRIKAIARTLAVFVAQIVAVDRVAPLPDASQHADPRIAAILAGLDRNLSGPLDLPALAATAGLSPWRLSHVVRERTGRSLRDHVLERRIARAQALLLEGHNSLMEVARLAGFGDQSRFTTAFRKATGLTPAAYRRRGC
jgi:AraC-like DNA-binding protein